MLARELKCELATLCSAERSTRIPESVASFILARSAEDTFSLYSLHARHCCFVVGCGLIIRGAEPAAQISMPAQLLLPHTYTASHCHCATRGASAVSLALVRPFGSLNWLNNNTAH